jgi:hypothetical protein
VQSNPPVLNSPPKLTLYHSGHVVATPGNPFGKDIANTGLFRALARYGDFQESCQSLAAIQAAFIKGSARTGSGSSVGLFIHTSAG